MKKAVIYCRVSTEEQAEEGHHSLDSQKRLCGELAIKLDYKVVKIFEDAGKSGSSTQGRRAFRDMIDFAKDEKIDAVLVFDSSRFARNVLDHLLIQNELTKAGVKLISYSNPNLDCDTPDGKFMNIVIAGVSGYHSDITKDKTKKGLEQKVLTGWFPGYAPLGYKNIADEKGNRIIVVDPKQAPLVQLAFDLYIQGGHGVGTINDILYDKGFRSRAGKKLAESKMYELIQNPFYIGKFRYAKQMYDGKHEPIISQEIFDMAQRVRTSRTIRKSRKRKLNFLLNGFVFCHCGRRLTAENHPKPSGLSFGYYHCTQGKKCTSSQYVPCSVLEKEVEERFMDIQFSEEFYTRLIEKLKSYYNTHVEKVDQEITNLTKSREELIKKRDNAENMLLDQTLDKETYQRLTNKLNEEISTYDSELHRLGKAKTINIPAFEEMVDFAKDIHATYKKVGFDTKRMYLEFFWHRFILKNKNIVEAIPTPLFAALQKMQKPPRNREVSTEFSDGLLPLNASKKFDSKSIIRHHLGE